MIYTVEQQSYCMPTLVGKETWYDNWVAYRLMDCRYREPQAAIDRQTMISIAIKDSTGRCRRVSDDDRIWNGQGMLAIRGLGGSIQSLTKEPEKITYEITSQRGELRDEAAFIMDLGIE